MKKHLIIALVLVTIALSACKKYLDIKPYGKTIPKTAEEFEALLHSMLNNIDYGGDGLIIGNASSLLSLECYADNLDASLTNYPGGSSLPIYVGVNINTKQNDYEQLYQRIRDCNIVINNLKSENTERDQNVLGTAYAIRAVCYFQLMRQFCEPYNAQKGTQLGVPLVLDFDMEARPLRSTLKETMALIERDFNKSIDFQVKTEVYRFTEDVVKAYQARYYFWAKDWDKAIAVSEMLLAKYPLQEGVAYTEMLQARNARKGNILLRSFIFSGTNDISYNSAMSVLKSRPVGKEFIDLFVEKTSDVRFNLLMDRKRQNTKNLMANIRTDEMCLILAEAYAHKSNPEKALDYLNQLRSKRIAGYTPLIATSLPAVNKEGLIKEDAMGKALTPLTQAILNERRKEFYGEGDRWFELKRNGSPAFWATKDGLKYITEPYLYTFPIPRTDVELVNGLVQNPGYTF
jgi:tetratricopeptide (TPR) repeat protein